MNRLQLNHIPSCQTTRGLLTRLPALFVLLGSSTFLQAQYEPVSPIAPTSVEECKTFSLAMSAFLRTMSKAHEQCLAQKIKEGAKASMESDSRICSQPACQQYHMDPKRAGDDNQKVSACYQEANQYVARKAEEKKLEEDQQKKRDAEQSLADKQRRDRAADQQKQQQSQADKQAQQKQQALADKERAATAAERATHLKAQAENAKRDRKDQERIAAARNAEELQRLEAQQNASREKALADQKERHRSRPADDSVAQQADRSDANGKQLLATMNADPFGTNRNGKTDPGPDVGSIADGPNPFAGAVEKQEAQKTNVPTVAAVSRSIAEYIQGAGGTWKSLNGEAHFSGALKLASDALNMTKTASGGEVPSTVPMVEKLADYADKEGIVLDTMAHRRTEDWLLNSGLNRFDRSTVPAAQRYVDDLSNYLSTIDRLNQHLLPLLQAAHDVLDNSEIMKLRVDAGVLAGPVGAQGLDPTALKDIIARLNGCSSQIDAIQNSLRLARSVIY
jgi:hypothetical protein